MDDGIGLAIEQDGERLYALSDHYTGFHESPLIVMDSVAGSKYNNSSFIINRLGA